MTDITRRAGGWQGQRLDPGTRPTFAGIDLTDDLAGTSAAFSGPISASNLSGTNTGDQTITLTGDVNGSGTGSFAATLATVNTNVGTFGSATQVPQFTVNGKGLVTAVNNVTISGVAPGGLAGGDLLSSYPNPTVAKINGVALGTTTATAGNLLIGSGTDWTTRAVSGDVTIDSTGVTTIGTSKVTNSMLAGSIADTKLSTISTAGKVSNSATTATSSNTLSAIVARDSSGNFSAGTITAALSGNATTATAWATARNLAGNSVDGSANVAFANKFIVQGTTDAGLSGAQFLGSLATGIVKNATTTGVLSIATAGTDYSVGTASLATGIVKTTTSTGALSIAVASDFPTLNQNTTGSAAKLTTPRAIYGNNFDGSAALTQVIASTYGGTGNGFAKFSGPATSEKTFTLPNASATILTSNATVTVAQGGTGQTSYTDGQLLIGNSTGNTLTKATLTGTANQVNVTNGAGSITLSLPQRVDTSADVLFDTVSINSQTGGSGIGFICVDWTNVTQRNLMLLLNDNDRTLDIRGDVVLSGTNTGDQTITLTGNVTGSGTGSFATTIANNAVSNAMLRTSGALSVIGRSANSTGNVADISAGSDKQVLRRSGTALGFGAIDLASSSAVSGVLANANTTATNANTASAIVARDASGNFSAGTLSIAALNATGDISTTSQYLKYGNGANQAFCYGDSTNVVFGLPSTSGVFFYKDSVGTEKVMLAVNGDSYFNGGNYAFGATTPATRIDVNGAITLRSTSTPSNPSSSSEGRQYVKGGKLIYQYNDAGTVRYKYLDLTGTGVTWVHTTTAP